MRVLSLYDGMSCGMLALQKAGIPVERYVAYEIDKYAIQTSKHNFPMIEHRGDVFDSDFTEFEGFDAVIGGSPCTYWSIAQKNNRETEASGMGWELFQQYVRAIREAKPKWFIYENNKSMSKAIRASIDEAFGFEAICINSALVSAQNRQRLYWVGKRNEDGTYSKVPVEQPEDLGILLKDVLDGAVAWQDKALCAEPVRVPSYGTEGKFRPLSASYARKGSGEGSLASDAFPDNPNKQVFDYVAEPVCVAERGRYENGKVVQHFEAREDGKTNVLTTVQKDNNVAEPARVGALPRPNGELSTSQAMRVYSVDGKSVNITAGGGGMGGKTGLYAISVGNVYEKQGQNGQLFSIDGKSKTLSAGTGVTGRGIGSSNAPKVCIPVAGECCGYAVACEWDDDGKPVKAMSGADGKTYDVYEVKDGYITIKGKKYRIKLADGFYIIRKLTVRECMRLQTVPEWYEWPVSDTQAYKMLGNGWTVDVIAHLMNAVKEALNYETESN